MQTNHEVSAQNFQVENEKLLSELQNTQMKLQKMEDDHVKMMHDKKCTDQQMEDLIQARYFNYFFLHSN